MDTEDIIRKIFEKHTIPEHDEDLTMFDTDAVIKEIAKWIEDTLDNINNNSGF